MKYGVSPDSSRTKRPLRLMPPILVMAPCERQFWSPTQNTTVSRKVKAWSSINRLTSRLARPPQWLRARNVPADLDPARLGLGAGVAAGADQAAGRAVDEHKTHFRIDRAVKEFPKT